ncbi:patatin-like phospholipase family protein [Roseibium denhamense]|uniref:NTE family protein n=1 Tax=Roseibium denhamense TaxID=76305 RepID=A0ABY1P2H7_9HYPH|nr:patatin-like phospholipase family protein [Roseibium denhamense]MTI07700.1 patatin-like phospholipase family protein [Roseibium denhamense]SMP24731.1 NTE family protein [Roseibium denhamense]
MTVTSNAPRIGLALGGGGARGLAHIPVLEALDDLGIKPVKIAGTSIGAILGAAYASGLSGEAIRDIALETFADRNSVLSRLWQLRPRKFADVFKPGPVQFDPERVLEVFVGAHLPDRFEDLDIALRVLATDFYGCQEVDFEAGPLLPAVAASVAIPAVFKPVRHDGRLLVDGGAVNPLPFDGLQDTCDIVIAVDVVGAPVPRADKDDISMLDSLFGSAQILMQTVTAEKLKRVQPDILIRPPHDTTRVLDFMKADKILAASEILRKETKEKLLALTEKTMTLSF